MRAAVLGANDGLVSNFSLVMGVAGGADNADFVVIAGVAGLLAGAFSMFACEYVSMRSQREIYEYQIARTDRALSERGDGGAGQIAEIYAAKGLPADEAERVAGRLAADAPLALDTIVRERLGLNPADLGSPWGAAASSFTSFSAGAVVPLLPYLAGAGDLAFTLSAVVSGLALFLVGATVALASGKGLAWGGLRMVAIGGAAAAATYGIGTLIGVGVLH